MDHHESDSQLTVNAIHGKIVTQRDIINVVEECFYIYDISCTRGAVQKRFQLLFRYNYINIWIVYLILNLDFSSMFKNLSFPHQIVSV